MRMSVKDRRLGGPKSGRVQEVEMGRKEKRKCLPKTEGRDNDENSRVGMLARLRAQGKLI